MDIMSKNIFRQKRTKNFTVVPNEFLHSRTLSFKSKGILTYLLSLPSDWELHVSHLATISTDGRDSVYNGIQELIEAKYIWRRPRSGIEPGGWEYFVYDAPELDCPFGEKPHTENPHTEKPDTENPESGKPATTKYYLSKERTKGEQKPEEQTTDSEFESFYSSYPRKVAKPQAKKAWSKNKCVLAEVLPALEQHKKTWKDPQFVPYPATSGGGRTRLLLNKSRIGMPNKRTSNNPTHQPRQSRTTVGSTSSGHGYTTIKNEPTLSVTTSEVSRNAG
jgi:hypothetical protein